MMRHRQMMAQRSGAGRQGLARSVAFPLPTGGLFVEAKKSEVSGSYAATLRNWKSTGTSLETRPQVGYDARSTHVLQRIPFEFSANSFYITTFSGRAVGGGAVVKRRFNGKADVAYISGQALIVDGLAAPVRFDGSAFTTSVFTTSDGINPNAFDGVLTHHDRPYFWKRGGPLDFYYGDVGAVQGELERFPLGRLGNITGSIADILSLTVDAGHGMNDTLCILTTTGQMILYEGLDPGDPADWRLVTRVQAAPPVSGKPFTAVGSDLWMITTSGIVSVTEAIRQGAMALVSDISRPISDQILKRARLGGDWQLHTAADGSQVVISHVLDEVAKQWILYLESKTWATADYPARRWHSLGNRFEFTSLNDGLLGQIDQTSTGDEEITAVWHSSWFRVGRSSGIASLTPTILARGPLTFRIAVLSDHNETAEDLAEAWQTVTVEPDVPGDGSESVSLDEMIGCSAVGSVFQIRMEVTAKWAEIVNLQVSLT